MTETMVSYWHRFYRPSEYRRHFQELVDSGVDSLLYEIDEQEFEYRTRWAFPRAVEAAHRAGLKVYVAWCRFGMLFSGDRWVPSWFAFEHPQCLVVGRGGARRGGSGEPADQPPLLCCVNNAEFRDWFFSTTGSFLRTYDVDGVFFDEPKNLRVVCHCPACLTLAGTDAWEVLAPFAQESAIRFLADCCRSVKGVRPSLVTMLVAVCHESLTPLFERLASIEHLDVFGSDPYWMRAPHVVRHDRDLEWLRAECERVMDVTRRYGRRSQLWVQNIGVPKAREPEMGEGFAVVASFRPDMIATFYDIIQSEDPDSVWERTRQAFRQLKGR